MSDSTTKPRRGRSWLIQLLLVVAVLAGLQYWRTRDAASGPAPGLSGVLLDGQTFAWDTAPRPLLVHFWATWCPVCRMQQGTINGLARQGNVVTVALSSGDASEILGYLREHDLDLPVLSDPQGVIAARWAVAGVPTSFVVDADDTIRFVTSGYTTGAGLRSRLWAAAR
jgi:thiol-disulfide isomerase/thioredoxin